MDKAATLIDANINEITGATFDPVTHQLVFLGDKNPSTLHDVDLDLFTAAIQSVYGSAEFPFVSLDSPAKLLQSQFDNGDGSGILKNGKSAQLQVHYTPINPTEADDMLLTFDVNGQPVQVRLNDWEMNGQGGITVQAGDRYGMGLALSSDANAIQGLPSGMSVSLPPLGVDLYKPEYQDSTAVIKADIINGGLGGSGYNFYMDHQHQDSYWTITISNNSGAAQTIGNIQLVPDLQHRRFSGRLEDTRLGWIMEEADRVMKELGIGKEQSSSAIIYDSHNTSLPAGFENLLERFVDVGVTGVFDGRAWFTPNQEMLKRYVDPNTGAATVVFDTSTVQLHSESEILCQPQPPGLKAFVDFFNAHYDEFADISFPVHDPNDPTGTAFIQEKIFDDLKEAMKAVALARFFHDNNIPLDTWWLSSYSPQPVTIPETIPTLSNSSGSGASKITLYGGVSVKTPNTYLPDAVAQAIGQTVLSQRPASAGDLGSQNWSIAAGSGYNALNAVAASIDPQQQTGTISLAASDLSFASPGDVSLSFDRYYDSGYIGNTTLGLGWQPLRFAMQFQLPSFTDVYGLMRDADGNLLPAVGGNADTQIRSGEIRIVDRSSGNLLNFYSSLSTAYSLDAQGNPVFHASGLGSRDVPTFTPGEFRDGSALTQDPLSHDYILTHADGSSIRFDANGNLNSVTDLRGFALTYSYVNQRLTQIGDSAGQALTLHYDSLGRIDTVQGPGADASALRRVKFVYDSSNRLVEADSQSLQTGTTYVTTQSYHYQYNSSNQLTDVVTPDGLTSVLSTTDLRGRSTIRQDLLGNQSSLSYSLNPTNGIRTTSVQDAGSANNDPVVQGINAIKYFPIGNTSSSQQDAAGRTTQVTDPFGNITKFTYSGNSIVPSAITLPTPGRPSISIQTNSANLPTSIVDPVAGAETRIIYNAANLPTDVVDRRGIITHYTYTAWNDVASVTSAYQTALAATTTYNYNAQKLLQSVVDPLGHTIVQYGYDSLGRVVSITDGDGVKTSYVYDTVGHLVETDLPSPDNQPNSIKYSYNLNDQVTQISTTTANLTYQYDSSTHRLSSTAGPTGIAQYAYDPQSGLLTSVTNISSGGNSVTQRLYDRRGQLVEIVTPNGDRTSFRSDAAGRPTAMIEDDNVLPSAVVSAKIASVGTFTVSGTASEKILVATISYWPDGQSPSTAMTQSTRLNDQRAFTFNLSNVDVTRSYRYTLSLTDSAGNTQTSAQRLLPTNHAPTLNAAGSPTLTSIPENVSLTSNNGTLVSQIIAGMAPAGGISDVDLNAKSGIAIIGANQTTGTWQFTTNGSTWTDFGTTSVSNSLLLSSDAATRIRFLPSAGFSGQSGISYVAWDQSTGTNGQRIAITTTGGITSFSSTTETALITVTPTPAQPTAIGIFRNGQFYLDANNNGAWNSNADAFFAFGNSGDTPLAGNWNGDGKTDVGTFRSGTFFLDLNGSRKWESANDAAFVFGNPTDLPITGDWNSDGKTDVGIFRNGSFYLDQNGSRRWERANDKVYKFGIAGDKPIAGNWTATSAPASLVITYDSSTTSTFSNSTDVKSTSSLAGRIKPHLLHRLKQTSYKGKNS